jgi:hypothetical protein
MAQISVSKGKIVRNLLGIAAALTLLAGCATGWPLAHGPDPQVAETLQSAEPLVKICQQRFVAWLGPRPVTWEGGPTVTRDGTFTTIQIEARPNAADTIDPVDFRCEFEGEALGKSGPVS